MWMMGVWVWKTSARNTYTYLLKSTFLACCFLLKYTTATIAIPMHRIRTTMVANVLPSITPTSTWVSPKKLRRELTVSIISRLKQIYSKAALGFRWLATIQSFLKFTTSTMFKSERKSSHSDSAGQLLWWQYSWKDLTCSLQRALSYWIRNRTRCRRLWCWLCRK